jgi:hypothetical protein
MASSSKCRKVTKGASTRHKVLRPTAISVPEDQEDGKFINPALVSFFHIFVLDPLKDHEQEQQMNHADKGKEKAVED